MVYQGHFNPPPLSSRYFKIPLKKYFLLTPVLRVSPESDQVSERFSAPSQHSWSPSHPPPSRISHLSGKSRNDQYCKVKVTGQCQCQSQSQWSKSMVKYLSDI